MRLRRRALYNFLLFINFFLGGGYELRRIGRYSGVWTSEDAF